MRWDLFEGGEARGRERLVMDFFGNVQSVEVEDPNAAGRWNETEWREDLRRLWELSRREGEGEGGGSGGESGSGRESRGGGRGSGDFVGGEERQGAARVEAGQGWGQQAMGALALMGCAVVWLGASWLEPSKA